MKKPVYALTLAFAFLLLTMAALPVEKTNANPINVYSVPDIQISYPLESTGGYVNSTVQFEIYVYLPIDSEKLDSVSYSLDGQAAVNVGNLRITMCNEPVYVGHNIEKLDFKKYTAYLTLEHLPEGTHTLVAHSGNMSASQSFVVNSHYVIAELAALSPRGQVYFDTTVPLTFNVNVAIQDAHYYLYRLEPVTDNYYPSRALVSEEALTGNTTLSELSEGNYELLLFATTELGQTSEKIQFSVSNNAYLQNLPTLLAVATLSVISIVVGLTCYKRKGKSKLSSV